MDGPSEKVKIRPARGTDAEAIATIHVDAWKTSYRGLIAEAVLSNLSVDRSAARWRDVAESTRRELFVLEVEGRVVGFYHIASAEDTDLGAGQVGDIRTFYVDASQRGKGFGGMMCRHALEELRRRGFSQAILWVLRDNTEARRFYESQGFKPDTVEKVVPRLDAAGVRYRQRL